MTTAGGNDVTDITALGNGVTEVTVDGDVVWQAQTGPTMLDGFEHNDIAGNYDGTTAPFSIESNTVYEGSYALRSAATSGSTDEIMTRSDVSFGPGERLHVQLYRVNTASGTLIEFGVQSGTDETNISGYEAEIYDGQLALGIQDNGSYSAWNNTSLTTPESEWLDYVIEWQSGGTIIQELFDSTNTSLGSMSSSPSQYTTAGYIGFNAYSGTGIIDSVRKESL